MQREDRSFRPAKAPRMGELTPIDPELLGDRDLTLATIKAVHQTHGCLEQHIKEQTKVNAASALADLTIREDLQKLTLLFGLRKPEEGEKTPRTTKSLATWPPWMVIGALGGVGIGLPALAQLTEKVAPIVWAWLVGLS